MQWHFSCGVITCKRKILEIFFFFENKYGLFYGEGFCILLLLLLLLFLLVGMMLLCLFVCVFGVSLCLFSLVWFFACFRGLFVVLVFFNH